LGIVSGHALMLMHHGEGWFHVAGREGCDRDAG
jgi:hypothetical protein